MNNEAYIYLQRARCRLIIREPFYGTCTSMFQFIESSTLPTMGVRILCSGIVEALYNPEFILTLSLEQLYSLLIHECEHIIRLHIIRATYSDAWNVATDMAINGKRSNPTCCYKEEGQSPVVVSDDGCYVPEEWMGKENAETYMRLLPKCPNCDQVLPWDPKTGKGEGEGEGKEGKGKEEGKEGKGKGEGEGKGEEEGKGKGGCSCNAGNPRDMVSSDDHDTWKDSDISEDEARQIVKQIVEQAKQNARGDTPGHLEEYLNALNKPVVRWKEVVRRFLGYHAGGCRKTYSRKNRRLNMFGTKGNSHRAVATLGIIVDTSGSISTDDLKQFFAEIEAIASKVNIWILQWDAGFGLYTNKYRRGDWKRIGVVGRGGTRMDLAQNWVIENNIAAEAVIMLTDGDTPWREEAMPMPFFVCLNRDKHVPDYAEKIVIKINN